MRRSDDASQSLQGLWFLQQERDRFCRELIRNGLESRIEQYLFSPFFVFKAVVSLNCFDMVMKAKIILIYSMESSIFNYEINFTAQAEKETL